MTMTQRACGACWSRSAEQRGQRPEHRVAVIGAAAAIKLVAFDPRDPRPVPLGPADHLRLLVEMAVEQHRIGIAAGAAGGHLDQHQRRAAGQPDDLERRAGQRGDPRSRPALEQLDGIVHIAVLGPLRIEGRRFVRDLDVLDQRRDDIVAPALIDQFPEPVRIQHDAPSPVPRRHRSTGSASPGRRRRHQRRAGRFQAWIIRGRLAAAVAAQLVEHREIQKALERHDQLGQALGRDPFPGVEFRVLGGGGVDIAVLAGKAHREPFLPLAAIAPAPRFAGKLGRQVVVQPARGFAENFGLVGADLLVQFAQRGLARGLAGVDPALRHLPGREPRRHADAAPDKHQALPVHQHDADPGAVGTAIRCREGSRRAAA